MDAFWRLCSRWLFENIVTKEEIAQYKQFLLLPQYFPLLVIGYPFKYVKSRLLQNCCMRERVKGFDSARSTRSTINLFPNITASAVDDFAVIKI